MLKIVRKPKAGKRGFNLIEAAIVLGVVGLVIGGIWVAAAAVQSNLRKSDAAKGLIQIVQNTRNLYYGQTPSAAADITAQLVSARALPGDFINGTAGINPFNGAVTVNIPTGALDTIDVAFAGVPRDACIDLTSKNTNISTGLGLTQVAIDATGTGAEAGSDATITTFPYLPTAAATNCGRTNTITWRFGIRG